MCTYRIDDGDREFGNVYYNDQRQRQLTFGCPTYQYCCGMECCRSNPYRGRGGMTSLIGLVFLILMALLCCLGCGFIYKKYRGNRSFSTFISQPKFDAVPQHNMDGYQTAQYQVPVSYPAPNYAPTAAYPAQPYPAQYPNQTYPYPTQPPMAVYPNQ